MLPLPLRWAPKDHHLAAGKDGEWKRVVFGDGHGDVHDHEFISFLWVDEVDVYLEVLLQLKHLNDTFLVHRPEPFRDRIDGKFFLSYQLFLSDVTLLVSLEKETLHPSLFNDKVLVFDLEL